MSEDESRPRPGDEAETTKPVVGTGESDDTARTVGAAEPAGGASQPADGGRSRRAWVRPLAYALGGLVAGVVLTAAVTAMAAGSDDDAARGPDRPGIGRGAPDGPGARGHGPGSGLGPGMGQGMGPGTGWGLRDPWAEPLDAETLEQVRAAVLEEFPDATVVRVVPYGEPAEGDAAEGDAAYRAFVVTSDDRRVLVTLDGDFTVLGSETVPDVPSAPTPTPTTSGTAT